MQLTGRRVLEMRKRRILFGLALAMAALFSGCGGGGGSSGGSGTISMNITDSKPVLPVPPGSEVESVTITFDVVSVHKSGGGWETLDAVQQPFTIDLYQFRDGAATQFVPPVKIPSGKYTQVRIGVTSAEIRIKGLNDPLFLEIPSDNLKTDKNFEFEVPDEGAVDLTVDFDLSQSIVVTGTGTYQLKPVLHINETSNAATITGTITWDGSTQATVIVYWDKYDIGSFNDPEDPNIVNKDEEYTRIFVKDEEGSSFEVFWLVPGQDYIVRVLLGDSESPVAIYEGSVSAGDLHPGATVSVSLNKVL
jgi:hypothetical protein